MAAIVDGSRLRGFRSFGGSLRSWIRRFFGVSEHKHERGDEEHLCRNQQPVLVVQRIATLQPVKHSARCQAPSVDQVMAS